MYNGGQALPDSQAEPDLHELHRLPNSGRHLCITMRAPAWEPRSRISSFARLEAGASRSAFPSWSLGMSTSLFEKEGLEASPSESTLNYYNGHLA